MLNLNFDRDEVNAELEKQIAALCSDFQPRIERFRPNKIASFVMFNHPNQGNYTTEPLSTTPVGRQLNAEMQLYVSEAIQFGVENMAPSVMEELHGTLQKIAEDTDFGSSYQRVYGFSTVVRELNEKFSTNNHWH